MIRELFVELSEQVLAAAVAQREERLSKVYTSTYVPPTEHNFVDSIELLARYMRKTWRPRDAYRRQDDETTRLRVKLACGHTGWFDFDEQGLVRENNPAEYICKILDGEPERKCTCVDKTLRPTVHCCVDEVCK